ncbi:MAG: trimeric intracellular cation channel family protein [Flavobacteriaceae bacterium]
MLFEVLDILGTVSFAVSGVLTAYHKKLDPFGVFIIAFVTAVGGGTLRDVLIGNTPVTWMVDVKYMFVISLSVVLSILFIKKISYLRTSLFLFDTIGLGVFTIIGIEKGIDANLHPVICLALGTITASFGGVIRDILSNEIPVIFRKEIYATACVVGGIMFLVLYNFNVLLVVNYSITSLIIIVIRILAVKFNLSLPTLYKDK